MGVSPLGLLNLNRRTQMLAWLPSADFGDVDFRNCIAGTSLLALATVAMTR